jgi:DNA-binding CsgD family transcriptional regulator
MAGGQSSSRLVAARATGPATVGREDEVATVVEFVAGGGDDRALVLTGDAGIGKTTILRAGLQRVQQSDSRVLRIRLSAGEAELPFAALGDLLEEAGGEGLTGLAAPQREAIEIALGRAEGKLNEYSLSRGLLELLRGWSAAGSVLLVIDDVQWLDRPTASALTFALRRVDPTGLRVLVVVRSADGEATAELPLGLAAWEDVREVAVGPLSVTAIGGLLRDRVGVRLPRPQVEAVHEMSGGNPLFAVELARQGMGDRIEGATWRGVLADRLRGLEPGVQGAVSVAASALRPSPDLVLAAGVDRVDLRAAIESGVLEQAGERLTFTHPLFRSVAYELLLPDERREVHRRLAAVSKDPVERGHHVSRATTGPDAGAADTVVAAAEGAAVRGDHAGAAGLYRRAAELAPEGDRADEWDLRASVELAHAGDPETSVVLARGLVARLPPGARRARARHMAVMGMSYEEGVRELTAALTDARGDHAAEAEIHVDLSEYAVGMCRLDEAVSHARTAAELASGAGESKTAVAALSLLGFAESVLGGGVPESARGAFDHWDGTISADHSPRMDLACCCMHATRFVEAAELFEQELAAAQELGIEPSEVVARGHLSEVQLRAGQWADALANARLALEHARQASDPQVIAAASCITAMAEAVLGYHTEARSLAAAGLAGAEEMNDFWWILGGRAVLGLVALTEEEPSEAVEVLEPAWELMVARGLGDLSIFPVAHVLGEALVAVGRPEEAETISDTLRACPVGDKPWCRAMAGRINALVAAGRGDHARARSEIRAALQAHADLPEPFEHARTLHLAGRVERTARHWGAARAALTDALERFDRLGAARWAEKTATDLARLPGRRPGSQDDLTTREREIAELVGEGLANKEVAAKLFVSVNTVEKTLTRVYSKLGVRSRTELAKRLPGASD